MKTTAECLPCLMSRVLETASCVTADPWLRKKVLLDVTAAIVGGEIDFERSPAEVTSDALARACQLLSPDPFAEERRRMTDRALALHPTLVKLLQGRPDPLMVAGRLAAIANDISIYSRPMDAAALVADAEARPFAVDDFEKLKSALRPAKKVLYLLDNAGEIVADRLLIEAIGPQRVTAVVGRRPLMRNAIEVDATQAGLPCRVITTGSDSAGVPISSISLEFRREMDRADVIIAKGESAYQTMEEGPWRAWYLMVARCPCTAAHLKVPQGSAVCMAKEAATTRATRRPSTTVARRA